MTDQGITDKIRKLLKLAADNPNVHEAANAFAAAQDIANRNALDLDDIETGEERTHDQPRSVEEITRRLICEFNGKAVYWKLRLADAVTNANGCSYFYNGHRGISAYGQPTDLEMCAIVFNAIEIQVEHLAREAVKRHKTELVDGYGSVADAVECGEDSPRVFGRNFRLGAVHEIGHRLRSRARTIAEEREKIEQAQHRAIVDKTDPRAPTTSLARIDRAAEHLARVDAAIDDFRKGLNLGSGSSFKGAGGSGSGYGEGRRAGRTVGLGGGRSLKGSN
jgi:hypothetical protein